MTEKSAKTFFATIGVIACVLVVFGCTQQREREGELPVVTSSTGGKYSVTVVEGCEYLAFYTHSSFYTLSHKGNCTNSIHIYKAEYGK